MTNWLVRLLPMDELIATVRRFPLSVVCATILFIIAFAENHKLIDFDDNDISRVIAILGCLYFWFGISKLIGESQKLVFFKVLLLNLVGGGAIAALILLSNLWGLHLLFLMPALLLGIMFAPFLTSGNDISVWFFNRMMWFGVIVSYAALILFAGGVMVALGAIQALFDVNISGKLYMDVWLFASLILGPVYALSWVPRRFEFLSLIHISEPTRPY